MPIPTHRLGPADAVHRVLVSVIADGQGHAACEATGCNWQHVDCLPWLSYEHGLAHVEAHLTDAQRAAWSPLHKHGYEPQTFAFSDVA